MDVIKEFFLTFSNTTSLFSSKKIERFGVFLVFLVLSVVYIIMHMKTLVAGDFVLLIGTWLGYGGINSILLQRDKKIEQEIIQNANESTSN